VSMVIGMCKAMPCPEGHVCGDGEGQPGLYLVQKQARQVLAGDVAGYKGNGIGIFAGQSAPDAKYNYQDIANYWCQAMRMRNAVAWTPIIIGAFNLNYIRGSLATGQREVTGYGCAPPGKCLKELRCQMPSPPVVAGYNGNGIGIFAGLGTPDGKYNYQDIANYWCQAMQQGNAAGWTPINGGSFNLNYIQGSLATGQRQVTGYGCGPNSNCFKELTCEATPDLRPIPPPTAKPTPSPTNSPTSYPTSYPTSSPTSYPTKSPTHSVACQSWCEGDGRAWTAKCGFNACLGCDNCADTPGQLKPGGQFCEGWCKGDTRPWTRKCTFKQACGDCTGC